MNNLKKEAQVTIFIILGILILVVLILIFISRPDFVYFFLGKPPIEKIEQCISDSLKDGLELTTSQGGSIDPENYYLYKDNKISYICYTDEPFKKCVMQKPFLKKEIEDNLKMYVKPRVEKCLVEIKDDLNKKGGSVSYKDPELSVELFPGDISVNMKLDLTITQDDKTSNYENIKTDKSSKLYEMIMIASSIVNSEVEYGDSDTTVIMLTNKWLKVEKLKQGKGTTVYILTYRESGENFMFATKSIPIPPGWSGEVK